MGDKIEQFVRVEAVRERKRPALFLTQTNNVQCPLPG
jgi:hypothetical protein